jgi:catechol 2,3-dioxygenase-like lactoylglutathione lyase family enzyme
MARARVVGINHVALEVGDVDEALDFYGRMFEFGIRERSDEHALICMGDQVLALFKSDGTGGSVDDRRHVGIVVTDRRAVAEMLGADHGDRLDVVDPWGNHVQIVDYAECRFRKAPEVQVALGLDDLEKSPDAVRELEEAGLVPVDTS